MREYCYTLIIVLFVSFHFGDFCEAKHDKTYDYIIVGAGPAGLQMGYFLKSAGRDYLIVDKANISGNFFTTYPRHDMLISINKRHTGQKNKEFNMRHDWNSLISDNEKLLMKHYSKKMFPSKDALIKFLNDYEKELKLNVQHNTEVSDIKEDRDKDPTLTHRVSFLDQHGNVYKCRTLIVATGFWKPNKPEFSGIDLTVGYEDMILDPEYYEGKSVMILGRGNTAFEVADSIYGSTNSIHMVARSRIALSWETHYVGDVRAINNALLDTYQLKSLDGILEGGVEDMRVSKLEDGKLRISIADDKAIEPDNNPLRNNYDVIIRCMGWKFDDSIFQNKSKLLWSKKGGAKYPLILHNYRGAFFDNVYFAGTITHSLDYRKSAGAFIHGFRYTTRALHHILEHKNHQVQWPHTTGPVDQLLSAITKRINEASGIYQMFSVLIDVIVIHQDGQFYSYYEEFPVRLVQRFQEYSGHKENITDMIVMTFEYGKNFSGPGKDVFRSDRATAFPDQGHTSNFLHPVFYYYKSPPTVEQVLNKLPGDLLPTPDRIHHIVEDFLTEFSSQISHILPLRRFLEFILNKDMRHQFVDDCFKLAFTHASLPHSCKQYLAKENAFFQPDLNRIMAIQTITK